MTICSLCTKRAFFNNKNEIKALYCSKHKLTDMVNIVSKRCIHKDCYKQPLYNFEDEKIALYCSKHKLTDMINIKHKRCVHKDCKTMPVFNFEDENKTLYCSKHKLDGMIDIKNKRCIHKDCGKQSNYNFKDKKIALYCKTHKLEDMIDIKTKRCINENCSIISNYNYKNKKIALYCSNHKLDGMVDIKTKKCILCDFNYANRNYKGHCYNCYCYKFPMDTRVRNHKTKENAFMSELKKDYPDMILDKTISESCSKRRPDGFLECYTHVIIIEIDENQHQNYSCENKRMMELSQDLSHRPIVFIRFNPDDYTNQYNIQIQSCWKANRKSGILYVPVDKEIEWNTRLEHLKSQINFWIDNPTDKTIEIVHLFYDF